MPGVTVCRCTNILMKVIGPIELNDAIQDKKKMFFNWIISDRLQKEHREPVIRHPPAQKPKYIMFAIVYETDYSNSHSITSRLSLSLSHTQSQHDAAIAKTNCVRYVIEKNINGHRQDDTRKSFYHCLKIEQRARNCNQM